MAQLIASHEREGAVAFLSAYSRQMEDLMAILSHGASMSSQDRLRATETYRTLKNRLKEDCKRLSQKQGRREATHIETAYLLPAVCNASVQMSPATNTNPQRSNWFSAIYSAKTDIDLLLNQLRG